MDVMTWGSENQGRPLIRFCMKAIKLFLPEVFSGHNNRHNLDKYIFMLYDFLLSSLITLKEKLEKSHLKEHGKCVNKK